MKYIWNLAARVGVSNPTCFTITLRCKSSTARMQSPLDIASYCSHSAFPYSVVNHAPSPHRTMPDNADREGKGKALSDKTFHCFNPSRVHFVVIRLDWHCIISWNS